MKRKAYILYRAFLDKIKYLNPFAYFYPGLIYVHIISVTTQVSDTEELQWTNQNCNKAAIQKRADVKLYCVCRDYSRIAKFENYSKGSIPKVSETTFMNDWSSVWLLFFNDIYLQSTDMLSSSERST